MRESLGKVAAVFILVLIIGSMLATTFLPGLTASLSQQPAVSTSSPLDEPAVVFPAPDPVAEVAAMYIHPGAVFYLPQLQGFTPSSTAQTGVASVTQVDSARYVVVHAYVQQYDFNQDVPSLDAQTNPSALAASWSQYEDWRETGREAGAERLSINFELELAGSTYLARHITWAYPDDSTWAYVLRLVAPVNNPDLLDALQEAIIPSYAILPAALDAPLDWPALVDAEQGYALRHPAAWTLVDGGPGSIATISGDGVTVTLAGESAPVDDEDAAAAWVEANRAGAEVLAVADVTRSGGSGYAVAYAFSDADGAAQSGMAVLLTADDGQAMSANLRLAEAGVNLLAEDAAETHSDVLLALESFAPLPPQAMQ
jgi:hypothetical protein